MARKPKPTKTINPLHFEDLDPKRFEDLIRRLLYGFRDWDSIEPTGRAGADEGFDSRAWEKSDSISNADDEGVEGTHTLDKRLWQIQCKREKSITPAKMRTLIQEGASSETPPYGYILAAATNISKATYDVFREELRAKGVLEFYFWGKDHLEDQLSLPVNDEILFTFFGLSLSARRRSRTTEVKFEINNKNKILRLLFGSDELHGEGGLSRGKPFLVRDIKADQYPRKAAYPDFETHRRWEEHDVVQVTPRGLVFKIREYYAYLDPTTNEWDYTRAVDLTKRTHNIDEANQARLEDAGKRAERYWRRLPHSVQARLMVYGYLRFQDILIIDDRGDIEYTSPHLYIDLSPGGPFHHTIANLVQHNRQLGEDEFAAFTRVSKFPERFPEVTKGAVHERDALAIPAEVASELGYLRGHTTIFAVGGPLAALGVGDLIHSPAKDSRGSEGHAEVTHVYKTTVADVAETHGQHQRARLNAIAGRELADSDDVLALEIHAVYYFGGDNPPTFLETHW